MPDSQGRRSKKASEKPIKAAVRSPLLPSKMFSATTKGVTAAITAVKRGMIA
jgi:hypothetical protein